MTFTKGLAQEVIKKGICANTVAPGPVWTPFIVQSFDEKEIAEKEIAEKEIAEKEIAEFGKDSEMGRPAQPAKLAPADVFLASNESKGVNGKVSVSRAASRSADRRG